MPPVQLSFAGWFPGKVWNFKGAYMVGFMTAVSCSACVYTCIHYIRNSPDFAWREEMRKDEDQQNSFLKDRARDSYDNSFFRKLGMLRDRSAPGGPNEKDTRIFRGFA
ncbi:cellulose synthase [Chlorella sorokiniana]|uniref:Cellulose synthase n=1 Tax=Chlorella sorokiniana TaxID=3076 RepID=A0A2P6TPV5_CHLSO|nr:cellulose synthase [Chlorella sorokiniana]|eukprot:PRW56058.1 cellulose synthase [Chlorella sorokiniana]